MAFSLHSFTVFRTFYIHGHMTAFRWYDCQWPWAYFKVIGLFHVKFLKNGVWYGKSYYRKLIVNHTSFQLVPLLMTLNYIWRSLQPRLSFPRPFQQPLACFRVARSPSNSWASCTKTSWNRTWGFVILLLQHLAHISVNGDYGGHRTLHRIAKYDKTWKMAKTGHRTLLLWCDDRSPWLS